MLESLFQIKFQALGLNFIKKETLLAIQSSQVIKN